MEFQEHLEALRREGELLAAAAARGGPDAYVPTCPEWAVRDLVHHTGGVHRWAAAYVLEQRTEAMDEAQEREVFGPMPDDADLLPWFREGLERVLGALRGAAPDLDCWYFLASPSPRQFWARHQAHETAIHRVDAEAAAGDGLSPVPADFGADGVDELVSCFHTRPFSRLRADGPRLLHLRATDAGDTAADWYVHLSLDAPTVERDSEQTPDCTVSGPAEALYLTLWNRSLPDLLEVEGDASLLELWRERSAITW
ncbi:maleylpyruvate isomerase family mycothiol-dependent enzyme [Wenjunlia tyrosinilytica]|uniref:Maleylpyruvate isomerase family mycothiol-dependent enzyme n=1 Tax=Wenjunlia tyrosinilytica TaxID=1544741 RepID=A0A918E1G7_9ACTN|nr:maleylpyruvate isomerase family mycothiol-dependent enzyme [Wenjunlia tyrosinilytica]GGO96263.1 hypothetical protein GCM10012280_55360 [Wenjunlia tyrosinilytica]